MDVNKWITQRKSTMFFSVLTFSAILVMPVLPNVGLLVVTVSLLAMNELVSNETAFFFGEILRHLFDVVCGGLGMC